VGFALRARDLQQLGELALLSPIGLLAPAGARDTATAALQEHVTHATEQAGQHHDDQHLNRSRA
jgi:hypothetical protein